MEKIFKKFEDNPWWNIAFFEYFKNQDLDEGPHYNIITPVDIYQTNGIKLKFQGLRWENKGDEKEAKYVLYSSDPKFKQKIQHNRVIFPLMIDKNTIIPCQLRNNTITINRDVPELDDLNFEFSNNFRKNTLFKIVRFKRVYSTDNYKILPKHIQEYIKFSDSCDIFVPALVFVYKLPTIFLVENSYERMTAIIQLVSGIEYGNAYLKKIASLQAAEKLKIPNDLIEHKLTDFAPEEFPEKDFRTTYVDGVKTTTLHGLYHSRNDEPAITEEYEYKGKKRTIKIWMFKNRVYRHKYPAINMPGMVAWVHKNRDVEVKIKPGGASLIKNSIEHLEELSDTYGDFGRIVDKIREKLNL